jgi:hypothetical protein
MRKRIIASASKTFFVFLTGVLAGCCSEKGAPVDALPPEQLNWVSFAHAKIPYALRYPDLFQADQEQGGSTFFRYNCEVPVVVRFHDEKEGRKRGAWFGNEPVEEIQLSGRAGRKYIYHHQDGPYSVRTIAYVVAYRDKYLALEFRTLDELNEVQKRILDSFTIPAE